MNFELKYREKVGTLTRGTFLPGRLDKAISCNIEMETHLRHVICGGCIRNRRANTYMLMEICCHV